jgi:outer membrane immunogenic protein
MKKVLTVAALCLLLVTAAPAQGIGLYDIGGGLGFVSVSPSGTSESFTGFGFNARANLGELTTNLYLVPELNFWSTSKDIGGGTWKFSDFAINGNVQYRFDMDGSIQPYVGGGLGLNFVKSTVEIDDFFGFGGSVSATDTEIGINLIGGALFNLEGNITPFGELRYVLVSNMNHLMIQAGIMYAL